MKTSSVLALVALATVAAAVPIINNGVDTARPAADFRLIQLSENHAVWLNGEEIAALTQHSVGFMDITDHHDVKTAPGAFAFDIPAAPSQQATVNQLNGLISSDYIFGSLEHLQEYENRYYTSPTGLESAQWAFGQMTNFSSGRSDISINYFEHSWLQPSIVARIQGELDETVVIGGHIDTYNNARSPGADDDGTGTVQVLEAFRIFATSGFQPKRSLEFHIYAAEEVGLRGSGDVAEHYGDNEAPVVAYLNFDMTCYVNPGDPHIGLITDQTDSELNDLIRALIDEYLTVPWRNSRCNYGCSDHAPWTRQGYRAAFPFETEFSKINPYIHSTQDLVDKCDKNHPIEFAKLANAFLVEVSSFTGKQ